MVEFLFITSIFSNFSKNNSFILIVFFSSKMFKSKKTARGNDIKNIYLIVSLIGL